MSFGAMDSDFLFQDALDEVPIGSLSQAEPGLAEESDLSSLGSISLDVADLKDPVKEESGVNEMAQSMAQAAAGGVVFSSLSNPVRRLIGKLVDKQGEPSAADAAEDAVAATVVSKGVLGTTGAREAAFVASQSSSRNGIAAFALQQDTM